MLAMKRYDNETSNKPGPLTRRAALARLGLGAAVAYSAPTVMHLDRSANALRAVLEGTYGPRSASLWLQRWRLFFLACSELFGFRDGAEWGVSHYRLRRPRDTDHEVSQ